MKDNILLYKQRYNDLCIMEDILDTTPPFTNIKRLNTYRLYIHITFLSEISNIKGTAIITRSLSGDKNKFE